MKKKVLLITVLALIIFGAAVGGLMISNAAETEDGIRTEDAQDAAAEPGGEPAQPGESPSFTDIFYEKWLPIIIAAASGAAAFLVALFPLIKQIAKYKGLQGAYTAQKNRLAGLEEQLKSAAPVDYSGVISKAIDDKFRRLDKYFAEDLAERQLLAEKLEKLTAAAAVAWKEAEGAIEILSTSPSAAALKKKALLTEKLKNAIAQFKGEEAEKIIARIEEDIEEGV